MTWRKILLTPKQLMFGEDDRLKAIFEDLSKKGLHQKGMALFIKRIIKKPSHDNYEYTEDWEELYASPIAFSVLQKMNELNSYTVIPIEKPSFTDLEPLYWKPEDFE